MNIPPDSFLTLSMKENIWGNKIARILAASLDAVEPSGLVSGIMRRDNNNLHIDDNILDLEKFKRIILIGIGKASVPMSAAAAEILGKKLTSGIILTKKTPPISPNLNQKFFIIEGGHPVPDQGSQKGAQEILRLTDDLSAEDLVLILLSGGGSSLFTAPAPGISLDDLKRTNQVLLSSGADIGQINTIRKHISLVKGGLLAKHIYPAKLVTLILSDVMEVRNSVFDPVDMVASGPTSPDPTTFEEAMDLIAYLKIEELLPVSVINHLDTGRQSIHPETPKPGDEIFEQATTLIIGSNKDAVEAGLLQAQTEGFIIERGEPFSGEAKEIGFGLASTISHRESSPDPITIPICSILGGESTVTLSPTGKIGKGGRNLELALGAMEAMDGLKDVALVTLASDGEDGVTGAAGAIVTGESYQRSLAIGIDPSQELAAHNSYPVFKKLDDLIITGPTFTNVNDLIFTFLF
jgi:hydroxypyruvate reductase